MLHFDWGHLSRKQTVRGANLGPQASKEDTLPLHQRSVVSVSNILYKYLQGIPLKSEEEVVDHHLQNTKN